MKKMCELYITALQLKKLYLILNRVILILSKISSLFTVCPTIPENIVLH